MAVFVVQQPGTLNSRSKTRPTWTPNLESALKYGPLKFVFDAEETISGAPTHSLIRAAEVLKDFDTENDYLLWPGVADPSAFFCCTAALCAQNLKRVNLLIWNRNLNERLRRDNVDDKQSVGGFYVPVRFHLAILDPRLSISEIIDVIDVKGGE